MDEIEAFGSPGSSLQAWFGSIEGSKKEDKRRETHMVWPNHKAFFICIYAKNVYKILIVLFLQIDASVRNFAHLML